MILKVKANSPNAPQDKAPEAVSPKMDDLLRCGWIAPDATPRDLKPIRGDTLGLSEYRRAARHLVAEWCNGV